MYKPDYKYKYLKYKKLYNNLKNEINGGSINSQIKKGMVVIFVPTAFGNIGWYGELLHYYDFYSELEWFKDRVYILGDNNISSTDEILDNDNINRDLMPDNPMESIIRTASVEGANVNRRLGSFSDEGLQIMYQMIDLHTPDVLHFHFLTHGREEGIMSSNGISINTTQFINKLIIQREINVTDRILFIHTDSCYGGNFIENVKDKIIENEFDVKSKLFLTADVYDMSSFNIYKSKVTPQPLCYYYKNTILTALSDDTDYSFNEMFGTNGFLHNNGGKVMLNYGIKYLLSKLIRIIQINQLGMTQEDKQTILKTNKQFILKIYKHLFYNWDNINSALKNLFLVLTFLSILDDFNEKLNNMLLVILKSEYPSLEIDVNHPIILKIKEYHNINNLDDLLGQANLKSNIDDKLDEMLIDVIERESMISYNYQVLEDDYRTTSIKEIFGSLKN